MAQGCKVAALSVALLSALLLSACTSTSENSGTVGVSQGAAAEADQARDYTNHALEQRLMGDYDLIKQVSSQIDKSSIYDESMQPLNKKEKCLVPFMIQDVSNELYWDGACKNGLASGMGRLVRAHDGKKLNEMLVEIEPNSKDRLDIYLNYSTERGDSEVGHSVLELKDDKLQGYSATLGYNDSAWLEENFDLSYRYEDTTNLVSYTKVVDMLNGEFSSIIAYPNFSHDLLNAHNNVLSNIDKTYRLLEGRTMIGLSYIYLKDGRLLMRDNATGSDEVLTEHPADLDTYIEQLQDKVATEVAKVQKEVDFGLSKVEQYRQKKCKRLNAFFRGDEVNQVCDYIFNLTHSYEQLRDAKNDRASTIETYRENQEERLHDLERHLNSLKKSAAK